MKTTITLLWCLCCTFILHSQENQRQAVYFDSDRHELRQDALMVLDALSQQLIGMPEYEVEIEANTDSRGTDAYNQALAERRANSVKEYLVAKGIPVAKTTTLSFGESKPLFSNDDPDGRQGNRRVDIIVVEKLYHSVDDLSARLNGTHTQVYRFDAGKSVMVTATEGTRLWIETGTFETVDGEAVSGEVEFTIQEAYSMADMMKQGLHTTSNGKMLVSGGMLNIEATSKGRKLRIAKGRAIQVGMPTNKQEDQMQLFYGTTHNNPRPSDWISTRQFSGTSLASRVSAPPKPKKPMQVAVKTKRFVLEKAPEKPKAPKAFTLKEPREPRRDKIKYKAGFFERIFTSKEKRLAKEEAKYQRALDRYEDRKEMYWDAFKNHEQEMLFYEQALGDYRIAYGDWLDRRNAATNASQQLTQAQRERLEAEYEQAMVEYKIEMAAWEEARKRKLEQYENEFAKVGGPATTADAENYFFAVNRLGWINCDKFYDIQPQDQTQMVINANNTQEEERVYVVFKQMKSIMAAVFDNGRYLSGTVPNNSPVQIIAYKVVEGKPYLAQQETTVGAQASYTLNYQPSSMKEIRAVMERMN